MFQLGQAAIDGIAFQQIFLQDPVRPLAELRTAMAFYPIANRDNDIEIIILDPVVFTVCGSCQGILDNYILP